MASVKLFAKQNAIKKDGRVQVYLKLIHLRKVKYIPLRIYVAANAFNFSTCSCTRQHPTYLTYNAKLSEKRALAEGALIDLSDRSFSPESLTYHIQMRLRNEGKPMTVGMVSEEIEIFNLKKGSPGNAAVYQRAVANFIKLSGKDPEIATVDYKYLLDYKMKLTLSGKKPNTVSNRMRTLRAIFYYAIDARYFPADPLLFPFKRGLVSSGTRGKKGKKDKSVIKDMENGASTLSGLMQEVVYTSLLQYYFQGCDLQDIVLLRDSNIKDNYLTFYRYKNRADVDPPIVTVKIVPKIQKVINFFRSIRDKKSDFIVPLCEDFDPRVNLTLYETRRKNFNRSLALACEKLKIPRLTCKDMRYYWASIAANMGVNEEDRMRAQGQKIPGVAEGYVDYDQTIIDKINQRVIK